MRSLKNSAFLFDFSNFIPIFAVLNKSYLIYVDVHRIMLNDSSVGFFMPIKLYYFVDNSRIVKIWRLPFPIVILPSA